MDAKVVLIQPADRLHPSAANALLKTLEEPRPGTTFILVSDRPQRLPATVRSRCFRVDFLAPQPQAATEWLRAKGIRDPEIALAQAGFAPLAAEELEQSGFWGRRRALSELLASPEMTSGDLAAKRSRRRVVTVVWAAIPLVLRPVVVAAGRAGAL